MDADFGLRVGVMLGAGGLWMLQNRSRLPDELQERLAVLERTASAARR